MNHNLKRLIPAFLFTVLFVLGSVPVFASQDAVDQLHNGPPPSYPTQTPASSTPDNSFAPLPSLNTGSPVETNMPTLPEEASNLPMLYPSDVQGAEEDGIRWIVKTYELSPGEKPDAIPRDEFERDGWRYVITDIVKKETAAADAREHIETVTLNTDTKEMADIMSRLEPTMNFTSEDGYSGILELDISTLLVETAGTKSSSFTATATREYPHLSNADTSLIPKTITEDGRTMTLQNVDWRSGNKETVDYTQLPDSYTAVATYSRTGTKNTVIGYITTAEYKGTLAKLIMGKTAYIAYFAGTEIAPATPKPTPSPTPKPTQTPEPKKKESSNPLPAVAGATAGAGLLGGVVFFFFLRKNVKVHNLKDGKYIPIGKARVSTRDPIINLTPFADKAASGSFILVLDKLATKQLSEKTLTINYGDKSFQHIVDSDGGGEYQFEIDF